MPIIQKYNPVSGQFDFVNLGGGSTITVVANYSALPAANTATGQFYWCSASQGTSWLPGSLGGTYYSAGLYYSNGVAWEFLDVPYQATQLEVDTGTNNDKFVTPLTLSNSSQFQYIDATSSIQNQLDSKRILINSITSNQTLITGVTSNEITYSFEVPANTFSTGDSPEIFFRNVFVGTSGTKINRIYLNNANSLSGASIIGTASSPSNALSADISRILNIKSTTITQVFAAGASNFGSQASNISAVTEYNIDWTSSVWIIIAIQLSNGSDSGVLSYFKLTT